MNIFSELSHQSFPIKDYIVDKKRIGKGSFSTIYKCKHIHSNKIYALKEILIDKNKNKMNIKREFEIMRKLNHRNIVKIHDVIIDTHLSNIYFIMDYYEYGDLSKFLNKKPLKEKFTQKYMIQLSNGLEYLLENNILHRDLKPQNILLSKNYDIKITDFGFATYYTKNTIINTLCGSPMYMAPEIITKNGYDYKSDLWSVGIILYEMVHGYTPFNVHNFIDLVLEIKKKNIVINVDISDNCKDLITKLCITNPQKRINWKSFFNHPWFLQDELNNDENKLMDINFNSIPNLNNFNTNEKQFCSFTHKSISENDPSTDLEFNFLDELSSSSSDEYISADDSIQSNDSNNCDMNNSNDITYNQSNNNNQYGINRSNDTNQSEEFETSEYHNDIPYNQTKSKAINIIKKKKFHNTFNDYEFINSNKTNDFVVINSKDLNTESLPTHKKKTLSESFREYLYSSIKLIKHSYDYMSNNSI
jgi:serine/threonine protein kinase